MGNALACKDDSPEGLAKASAYACKLCKVALAKEQEDYTKRYEEWKNNGENGPEPQKPEIPPVTGGGKVGGLANLEDYGNSLFSKAKENLIRNIAKDIAGILKISSSFADSADLKDVIAKFAKVVPNPRQNRRIKVDKKIHIDVCKKIARSINKNYKADLINVEDSAEHICQSVSEVLYSLFTGLHSEFLTISADVSRIMRNLNALQEYTDGIHTKLMNDLKECSPSEATNVNEAYKAITREVRRQHAYLANLSSGVIGPTAESLINLVEETNEFSGLAKDLRSQTGSREFTDKLSHMMSGTSSVAHAAYLVDKALKNLGMSLSEYKNTSNMKELRKKVYDTLVKKKPNSAEMHKLLMAADILYRNDLSHDDIAAHLSKKGGAVDGFISGGAVGGLDKFYGEGLGFADMVSDRHYKYEDSVFKGRLHSDRASIGKTIRKKDMYRERLFASLNQQIKSSYNVIIADLYKIGKKIGSEIPVSDKLHAFIRQLGYFSGVQPNRKNLHKALSGYRRDIKSEYVKHDFMKALESIEDAASNLGSGSGSAYFKTLEHNLGKLIKVVDDFNDTFTKTLTEVHVEADRSGAGGALPAVADVDTEDNVATKKMEKTAELVKSPPSSPKPVESPPPPPKPVVADTDEADKPVVADTEAFGGTTSGALSHLASMEGAFGGADSDFMYLVTMKKAIREIEYYFKIANIKSNLKIAASQQGNYTKNYENILGEECGMLIDKINSKFKWLTCETDAGNPGPVQTASLFDPNVPVQGRQAGITVTFTDNSGFGFTPCLAYKKLMSMNVALHAGATPAEVSAARKERWETFRFVMEYIRSAKVEMLEAAQSLDLYLSAFTEHLQNNPNDVKDFLKLLEQIEIVSKWFTDKSGDNLASVFESTSRQFAVDGEGTKHLKGDKHYYEHLSRENPAKFRDGVLITNIDTMKEFIIRLEKSFKSMRALENIIATFSKLNNKVGSDVKSIMSPGLIFKSFMKYSVATSLAIGKTPLINANGALAPTTNDERLYKAESFLKFISRDVTPDNFRIYLRPVQNLPSDGFRRGDPNVTFEHYFDPLYIGDEKHAMDQQANSHYLQTDEIFEMCIKSMITKVFTVVGAFSLFQRPAKDFQSNRAISNKPLRQILGGAAGGKQYTKIIPEATELYIRLTLLGEWYRDLFDFRVKGQDQNNNIAISMIPAFDGIWGRFVKVIFVDATNINDGGYTDTFARELVESINDIYNHYKSKYGANVCIKIMENFVAEVNLRYGLVKQSEINQYFEREKIWD